MTESSASSNLDDLLRGIAQYNDDFGDVRGQEMAERRRGHLRSTRGQVRQGGQYRAWHP